MGEVKRYDSYGYDGMSGLMKEHEGGDWVRSEDYDALRAENAELVAALSRLSTPSGLSAYGDALANARDILAKHRGE